MLWRCALAMMEKLKSMLRNLSLLEVHLFDFDEDLYGQHMRVALVDYLRPEMTFDEMAGMQVQMAEDRRRTTLRSCN